ncbi:MAG TPA: hypothetical protein VJ724_09135 [Tahibacter sp.]|nr:hypothetical protein [Tahibacter sp.]
MTRKVWLRLVSVLQIAGSGLGIALLYLARDGDDNPIASLAFGVLFAASIVAGVGLWRSVPRGLAVSALFWLAQVLHLSTSSFVYRLWTGPAWEIFVDDGSPGYGLFCAFGFSFDFDVAARPDRPFVAGINLFAIAVLILLWRAVRATKPATAPIEATR